MNFALAFVHLEYPVGIYLFKFNNESTGTIEEICS